MERVIWPFQFSFTEKITSQQVALQQHIHIFTFLFVYFILRKIQICSDGLSSPFVTFEKLESRFRAESLSARSAPKGIAMFLRTVQKGEHLDWKKKKNWDWFRKPNNAWVLFSWLKLDWLIDWLVGQKFDIGQWFIMNAGFALALEIPGNIFDCYNWGYYRHLVDRGQGYCQKPYSVQDGPLTTKNYIRHPPSPKLRTAWKKEIDLARDGKADKGKV